MQQKQMTGAQALIAACEQHGVTHIFGYPGGANIPVFDALYDSPIKLILARHEQGATHMGDGYARATGKAGVVLVTSGPGATNAITGILTASMDSVPLVVICGQTITANLGLDAFQEADVSGISYPVVKHSYLVKNARDIPRIIHEAFFLAESGRPGPVLIDLPKDIASTQFLPDFAAPMNLPGYQIPSFSDKEALLKIADALQKAKRPVLLAGHGVLIADAHDQLRRVAETLQIPVTTTLLGKGAFPERHPLSLGMLGMHGTAYANMAVRDCDLIMSIGSRWDDRIAGLPGEFCKHAFKIHIDIDPAEFNKIIEVDIFACGDARAILEQLTTVLTPGSTQKWLMQIDEWKVAFPLSYDIGDGLEARYVLKVLDTLLDDETIVVTDVGQHQMWAAQFCKTSRPNCWISSGGRRHDGVWISRGFGGSIRSSESTSGCGGRRWWFSDDRV